MSKPAASIKDVLDRLYSRYNHRDFIEPDPLQFVYRYTEPQDKEIVALLSAALAYGRVEQIEKSLMTLFGLMGESPYDFVGDFCEDGRQKLNGFKHRFTTGQDISDLLQVLNKVLKNSGSIEKHFLRGYSESHENILAALSNFCHSLSAIYSEQHGCQVSPGLNYLLANPDRGSACKRLNLFLRWMVRDDEVDVGLWKSIDKAKLIVPVDVHMGRLCKILGLYDSKTVSLSSAVEITKSFAEFEPSDPVKYDFALSRIGILEDCDGRYRPECDDCELFEFCSCNLFE